MVKGHHQAKTFQNL